MTNEQLQNLIDMYNSKSWNIPIHEFEIGPNVMFARIPDQFDKPDHKYPSEYFIIKSGKECVSIIQDRGENDLHWYVDPKHRKKGHLQNALRNVILPFIADHLERDVQRGSVIKTNEKALNYAMKQGFKKTGEETEDTYILSHDFDKIPNYDVSFLKREKLSSKREQELKEEFNDIVKKLRLIDNEMYCAFGNKNELNDVIFQIHNKSIDIEYFNNLVSVPKSK